MLAGAPDRRARPRPGRRLRPRDPRPDLRPRRRARPLRRSRVCAAAAGPVRPRRGFDVLAARGLEALREADTVVVPGIEEPRRGAPADAVLARCAPPTRAAPAWSRSAPAPSRSPPPALLDGPPRDHPLAPRGRAPGAAPGHRGRPEACSTSTRARAHLGRRGGRASTSACTSSRATTAPSAPTRSRGGWSSRRTAAAARRSSSSGRCPRTAAASPPPARGCSSASTSRSPSPTMAAPRRASASARSPATSAPRPARARCAGCTSSASLHARRLLEESDLPVEDIAARCGFGTATTLREHFARALHSTPTAYRRAFRTT